MSNVIVEINQINDDDECPICLEKCDSKILIETNCDHKYCEYCLNDWLKQGKYSCPICRTDILSYNKNNQITRIVPVKIKESVENVRINNIPVLAIINSLIYKNYKYKIYLLMLFGYNIYSFIIRYNLNNRYINLYDMYKLCQQNNTELEEIIEYQDNYQKFNIIV